MSLPLLAEITFNLRNVSDNQGVAIAVTGLSIVFVALAMITLFISLLPRLVPAAADAKIHETPAARPVANVDEELARVAAIGFALHASRSQRH